MFVLSLVTALLASTKVQAFEDGDDYDTIVRQLSNSTIRTPLTPPKRDVLGESIIHGGVAWTNSFSIVRTAGNQRLRTQLQGLQASLGIDLFSPYWMAEGTVRSFGDYRTSSAEINFREFDLKIIHKSPLFGRLGYRVGVGLAARYMKVSEVITEQGVKQSKLDVNSSNGISTRTTEIESEYSTPASVALVGFDAFLSKQVSLGIEASYRSSLISETIDNVGYDALVRLDAHF